MNEIFKITEADTCRDYITPQLKESNWGVNDNLISEQHYFTKGRIVLNDDSAKRLKGKKADYILRYKSELPIAIVEAKALDEDAYDGVQQAKEYAEILGIKFAYSTNGKTIIEFDFIKGTEKEVESFPSPETLWKRYNDEAKLNEEDYDKFFERFENSKIDNLHYYQEIAINKTVENILNKKKRILLNLATGTGKTQIAFQICWKLWKNNWSKLNNGNKPKILFLADRSFLVDDPKDKTFDIFKDARFKIENGDISLSREIYFSTYQAIAEDKNRPGLFKKFDRDFFDLIIIDECHRGSSSKDSTWRKILEYFQNSFQIGLTATPLRDENRDTYDYFGNPVYTYSLKQGIEDGFLAPYRVHRMITSYDAAGWRPSKGQLDKYGKIIPDEEYNTNDFERIISLRSRTELIAKTITKFIKKKDSFAKTIIFCVDQEHANQMRKELTNLNKEIVQEHPNYICRVTSDEGDLGKTRLAEFQDLENKIPVILTTSKLLSTGVDAPLVKNIVIARIISSLSEFKQIIGRGTRVRDDYDKYFFEIIDFTGSSTKQFADPDFNGEPIITREYEVKEEGEINIKKEVKDINQISSESKNEISLINKENKNTNKIQKYYVDTGEVNIIDHLVYELDSDGNQLNVSKIIDYSKDKVRKLVNDLETLTNIWGNNEKRSELIDKLDNLGVNLINLKKSDKFRNNNYDLLDVLCNLAFEVPLITRNERKIKYKQKYFKDLKFESDKAKEIIDILLDKYVDYGLDEIIIPDIFKIDPFTKYGSTLDISNFFGGPDKLLSSVNKIKEDIYKN